MNAPQKTIIGFSMMALLGLSINFACAATTVCETFRGANGPTTPTLTIAAAANLLKPMTTPVVGLIPVFLSSNASETIEFCYNSTGALVDEIKGNQSRYGLFLAANEDGPNNVCLQANLCVGSPFIYTKGVPVLWSASPGTVINLEDGEDIAGNATIITLAIANPDVAPYGKAAWAILNETDQWNDVQSKLRTYDNIEVTFEKVNNSTDSAGFVAASQICDPATGQLTGNYVVFTTAPAVNQWGVIINNTFATEAQVFRAFLLDASVAGGQVILTGKFCYNSLQ